MARRVEIQIVGDAKGVEKAFASAKASAAGLTGAIGSLRVGFASLAKSVIIVEAVDKAIEALTGTVHAGIEEFKENVAIQAQTRAAIKSTGDAAHVTAKHVDELGLSLSNLSGVNDEVIRQGENVLLAFTKIQNFAGKGNQIFDEATKATVDFAVRSGRSVQAAAVAVGRALQDPAKAAGSLRRAYVVLTEAEKQQIAAAVKSGDVLAAQRDIIRDLEKRYGGAAAAAGKTLPGALNILKERFRDLAAQGIAKIAPAVTTAARGLASFVIHLTEAKGAGAKFRVAFDGIKRLGSDLFNAVERQITSVDWGKLGRRAETAAERVAAAVGARLRAINWPREIRTVASAIGNALADGLQKLNDYIRKINWNTVGRDIAKGIGYALGAAALFISHLKLPRITHAIADVIGAALLAAARLREGIGQQIGQAVLKGIEAGLNSAKNAIIRVAAEIALKIIEPFTHLPFGIGKPAQLAKEALQQQLAQMRADAQATADSVEAALSHVSQAADLAAKVAHSTALSSQSVAVAATGTGAGTGADTLPPPPPATPTTRRTGLTAAQRNTFFDNMIARILLRGGLGDLRQQLAAVEEAAGLITERLAVTKDITRKLNLEDQLLQLAAQRRDLVKQLNQLKIDQITKSEFFTLGLGPTGDTRVPLAKTLRKRLGTLEEAVKGTFLDTAKTRLEFAKIRKVLSESIIPTDVRSKISQMFDQIRQELGQGAHSLTKFKKANFDALLSGMGLDPTQIRELKFRLSQLGPGNSLPGAPSPAFALAGAGTVQVHSTINLDGHQLGRAVTKHQVTQPRRRVGRRN